MHIHMHIGTRRRRPSTRSSHQPSSCPPTRMGSTTHSRSLAAKARPSHIHMHTYTCARHAHMHMHMHTCTHAHMHTCTHAGEIICWSCGFILLKPIYMMRVFKPIFDHRMGKALVEGVRDSALSCVCAYAETHPHTCTYAHRCAIRPSRLSTRASSCPMSRGTWSSRQPRCCAPLASYVRSSCSRCGPLLQ